MTLLNSEGRHKPTVEMPSKYPTDLYEGLRVLGLGLFRQPEPCNEPVAFRVKR